jgi:hypothetical protein
MASGRKDKKTDDIKVVPAREAGSGMATGKAAAQKDEQPAPASAPKIERVSTADVSGDGAADQATKPAPATGDPAAINNSHSNIKNAREASTGQATGKRVHNDLTIHKRSDDAPRK